MYFLQKQTRSLFVFDTPSLRQAGSKICNMYTPTHKTDFFSVYTY